MVLCMEKNNIFAAKNVSFFGTAPLKDEEKSSLKNRKCKYNFIHIVFHLLLFFRLIQGRHT